MHRFGSTACLKRTTNYPEGSFHVDRRLDSSHEERIKAWCAGQHVGVGPIRVFGLSEVATAARQIASSKPLRDNAALVAIKVLEAANMLKASAPIEPMLGDTAEVRDE